MTLRFFSLYLLLSRRLRSSSPVTASCDKSPSTSSLAPCLSLDYSLPTQRRSWGKRLHQSLSSILGNNSGGASINESSPSLSSVRIMAAIGASAMRISAAAHRHYLWLIRFRRGFGLDEVPWAQKEAMW